VASEVIDALERAANAEQKAHTWIYCTYRKFLPGAVLHHESRAQKPPIEHGGGKRRSGNSAFPIPFAATRDSWPRGVFDRYPMWRTPIFLAPRRHRWRSRVFHFHPIRAARLEHWPRVPPGMDSLGESF
jgi:hypothetical protein